jgi:hypothetical protein
VPSQSLRALVRRELACRSLLASWRSACAPPAVSTPRAPWRSRYRSRPCGDRCPPDSPIRPLAGRGVDRGRGSRHRHNGEPSRRGDGLPVPPGRSDVARHGRASGGTHGAFKVERVDGSGRRLRDTAQLPCGPGRRSSHGVGSAATTVGGRDSRMAHGTTRLRTGGTRWPDRPRGSTAITTAVPIEPSGRATGSSSGAATRRGDRLTAPPIPPRPTPGG